MDHVWGGKKSMIKTRKQRPALCGCGGLCVLSLLADYHYTFLIALIEP